MKSPDSPENQNGSKNISQYLDKCEKHFRGAIKFLKETNLQGQKCKTKLFELPWFLILGNKDSGKSTLLENSGLKFLLSRKNKHSPSNNVHCDWWGTRDATFLDCNSQYTIQAKKNDPVRKSWLNFLNLLKKTRTPALNGVLITFNIEDLSQANKQQQGRYFYSVYRRLNDLQKHLKTPLPVYIVLTKCDTLIGFSEFFDQIAKQEREQAWGVHFSKQQTVSPQALAESFDTAYDDLLKRLHERVVPRLHSERNQDKRKLIKDFPLQIESLKKQLAFFLQSIAKATTGRNLTHLCGMYFTSVASSNNTVDRLLVPLNKTFELAPHHSNESIAQNRQFFTQQLLKEIILQHQDNQFVGNPSLKIKKRLQPLVLASAAALVIACTVTWSKMYADQIKAINTAQDNLAKFEVIASTTPFADAKRALPALNLLTGTRDNLRNGSSHWLSPLVEFKQQQNLSQQAEKAYQQALDSFISQQLSTILREQMNKKQPDIDLLYGSLKAYIMLGMPNHFDKNYIEKWLLQYWQNNFSNNPEQLQQLHQHLINYFSHRSNINIINERLIVQAKSLLNRVPSDALSLAILNNENMVNQSFLTLELPSGNGIIDIFASANKSYSIPQIYSAEYFQHTYDNLIPNAVNTILQGNWVIGEKTQNRLLAQRQQIINATRQRYLDNYIKTWQYVIGQLQLAHFSNFEHAIQMIDSLSQYHSAVLNVLQTVNKNTSVTYNNIQTPISIKFQKLNRYFIDYPQGELLEVKANLIQLQDYLSNIANDANPQQAAFMAARTRMKFSNIDDIFDALQKQAQSAPAPLNSWLNNVVEDSWQLILNQSETFINQAWESNILPYYNNRVKNHYPMDKHAQAELSLRDFTQFFTQSGIFNNFYTLYFEPFIDNTEAPWKWRKLNGRALSFNSHILPELQRGLLISSIYFPNKKSEPHFKFLFKVSKLPATTKGLTIALDDQNAVFNQKKHTPVQFIWPGKPPIHTATISLLNNLGQKLTDSESGTWAWFKLLDKANVKATPMPNIVSLDFKLQGYSAHSEIVSSNLMNPFAPDLLPSFRLFELKDG